MASNTVLVKFLANTTDMKKGIGEINAQLTGFQKVMKGVGFATAAYFSAKPIVDFTAQSVKAFAGLEEATNKVNVVFKDSADEILKWGEANNDAYAMSESQMLQYVGTLGMIFNQSGVTAEATKEMSIELTKLAADIASFADVDVDRAFNALRGAVVGEREALKGLGIVINETDVKNRALADGLWDGKGAIDANAKAIATYRLIMEKTIDAQGDMIRTGDSISNVMKKVKAQSEDVKAAFGEGLVGAFGDADDAGEDLLDTMKGLEPLMKLLGAAVGGQLEPWGKLGSLVGEAGFWLQTVDESGRLATGMLEGLKAGLLSTIPGLNAVAAGAELAADGLARLNKEERIRQRIESGSGSGSPVSTINSELKAQERELEQTRSDWENLKWSVDGAQGAYARMYGTIEKTNDELERTGSSGSSGVKKVEKNFVKVKDVLKSIAKESDFTVKGIKTAFGKVPEATAEAILGATQVASQAIQAQQEIIRNAEQALESYAQKINQSVLGGIGFDLVKSEDGVVDATKSIEQWVSNIAEQSDMVTALSPLATQLPPAITQAIISSGAGKDLADALANNPELTKQLTDNYEKLAKDTYDMLSVPMANQFVLIGGESAVSLIDASKKKIGELKKDYVKDVRKMLKVKHVVDVEFNYINPPSSYGGYNTNGRSAVRGIQEFERKNGTKWRSYR